MKEGQIIKINYGEEAYKVKIIKVLEMFPNGNGFVKVEFPTGQVREISIRKEKTLNGSERSDRVFKTI